MVIQIQPGDGVPIYLQILNQVRYLVASGKLAPGEELPPIRVLAQQLLITPNTVARAYMELEHAGIIVKRHGLGTFVAPEPPRLPRGARRKIVADRADALLAEAHQLGMNWEELIALLSSRRDAMNLALP